MSLFGDGEIELYGYKFRVTPQPIQEQLASVFPGKIVIGDTRRVDDPIASTWTMQDWIDGGLKHWMDPTTDMNRFFFSSLTTWFNRQLTLLPLTRLIAPLAWSDGLIKQVRSGDEMNGTQYLGWDDRLTFLDSSEVLHEVSTGGAAASVGSGNLISEMKTYRLYTGASAGLLRLVLRVTPSGGGASQLWVYDGTSLSNLTQQCQAMTIWDNKFIRCDDTNQLFTSTDLSTWTALVGQTIVPVPKGDVSGLVVWPDLYGNDTLQVCTYSGLFYYDEVLQEIRKSHYSLPRIPGQGVGSIVHRDNMYFTHPGTAITRFTGTTVDEEGLNKDDQLPPAYRGNTAMLQTTLNFLIAAVSSSQINPSANPIFGGDGELTYTNWVPATAGFSGLYGQNHAGGGWHTLFLSDLQNTGCYWVGSSGASGGPNSTGYRLFFGTNGQLGIQDLWPDVLNPIYNPIQQFAQTGQLITPWNEAGWSEVVKLMIRQEAGVGGPGILSGGALCTTTSHPACNIVIDYGLDYDDNTWNNLATITSVQTLNGSVSGSPAPMYFASLNTTPPTYLGIAAKAFRFRFTLNRCDNLNHTPILFWSTLAFLKEMGARWGYRFQLDLTSEWNGLTPAAQADLLKQMADPTQLGANLGTFRFMVDGKWKVANVKVSELEGALSEGTLQRGVYNVALIAF